MRVDGTLPKHLRTDVTGTAIHSERSSAFGYLSALAVRSGVASMPLPAFPARLQGDACAGTSELAAGFRSKDRQALITLCREMSEHGFCDFTRPVAFQDRLQPWLSRSIVRGSASSLDAPVDVEPPTSALRQRNSQLLQEAIDMLEVAALDEFSEVKEVCSSVVFVNSKQVHAYTAWDALGTIVLQSPSSGQDAFTVAEGIVHEATHLMLYQLVRFEPVVTRTDLRFFSALRGTDRPVEGVFHAAVVMRQLMYVSSRILDVLGKYHASAKYAARLIRPMRELYECTAKELFASGCLSPLGQHLLEEGTRWLSSNPRIPI